MPDNEVCIVTHRQILEGVCPWCDCHIENGQVSAVRNSPAETRWNWTAIEEDLRNGDNAARLCTVDNLRSLETWLDQMLPLLALALTDSEPQIVERAEVTCCHMHGELSGEQTCWLEEQKQKPALELAARLILLGAYFASEVDADRATRAAHIYWLIEHHPDCSMAGSPEALIVKFHEAPLYDRAKDLWLQQCAARKSNAAVLGNAAKFFLLNEPELAEKLLLEAQTLEPTNPKWHEILARHYSLASRRGSEELRRRNAKKSLIELEMAEQIRVSHSDLPSSEEEKAIALLRRLHTLPNLARAAFDAGDWSFARQCSEECLALATGAELDEFFRNDGNVIQCVQLVLGRLALRDGNLDQAKIHLLEAGRTPKSSAFGPNMALAKELLERGEREVVLEYLKLCGTFWETGADRLTEWSDQIARGEMPAFGANLIY